MGSLAGAAAALFAHAVGTLVGLARLLYFTGRFFQRERTIRDRANGLRRVRKKWRREIGAAFSGGRCSALLTLALDKALRTVDHDAMRATNPYEFELLAL